MSRHDKNNPLRFAGAPTTIVDMFVDIFPDYNYSKYTEREMIAMVWSCAIAGKMSMDISSLASGVLLETTLLAARRDKQLEENSNV